MAESYTPSPEDIQDVLQTYKQTRSPFKTARKTGLDIAIIFSIIESHDEKLSAVPERNGGYGRDDIRDNLVARRKASERSWDNQLPEIAQARANYEAGTHILATGRDGAWLLLYSFERKGRPDPNLDGYFQPDVA